ncbi:hypothetical protein [Egicoccus sp. AB-alg6-2]
MHQRAGGRLPVQLLEPVTQRRVGLGYLAGLLELHGEAVELVGRIV